MTAPLISRGRRSLTVASSVVLLVAIAHTAGHLAPAPVLAADPGAGRRQAGIDGYHVPWGLGMAPSSHDTHMGLVFTMSVSLPPLGVAGLVFAGDRSAPPPQLSGSAGVSAGTTGGMRAVYWLSRVPPP